MLACLAAAGTQVPTALRADQILAELPPGAAVTASAQADIPWSPVILEVQTALARLGFYKGSIDGRFSIATGYAVRVYRKVNKLDPASTDWSKLLAHLESQTSEGDEVESRLDHARRTQIRAAREILDQRVELQAVLRQDDAATARPPAGDPYQCLVVPTADCLFRSAMESAADVGREEYRNWALRDLIRAQAMAGRYDAAMASLRNLTDPRLIFVALREIAEAMAHAGKFDRAVKTARLIPESTHRARALAAIAGRLAETRQFLQSRRLGAEALRLMARERDVADRVITAAGFAEGLAAAGDAHYAGEVLAEAAADLDKTEDGPPRDAAWARVARARLALGDQAGAIQALRHIEDARSRSAVIVAGAAETTVSHGSGRARQRLGSVDDLRYRVLALCDVAYSHFRIGDAAQAMSVMARADEMVETVHSPFAGSFARARIAETLAKLGRLDLAETAAGKIGDDALRARTLWDVAAARRASGDTAGADEGERRAIAVAAAAMSTFDRTAVLGDFAVSLARSGRTALAREAYGEAMKAVRRIKIDWWRVRALARAAGTLHELEARGVF